jgi:hypothetical protein
LPFEIIDVNDINFQFEVDDEDHPKPNKTTEPVEAIYLVIIFIVIFILH